MRVLDLGATACSQASVVGVSDEETWALRIRHGAGGAVVERTAVAQGRSLADIRSVCQGGGGGSGRGSCRSRCAGAGCDGDGGTVHVEFLLAVEPGPGEDDIAGRNVGRNVEVKVLQAGVLAALAMGAVALPGCRDLEGIALVDGEADLAGSAVVIADAGEVEVLLAAGGPGGHGGTLRGAEELEVAAAGEGVFTTAAVVGKLEAFVGGIGAVRVVGCTEGWRVVELHVSEG